MPEAKSDEKVTDEPEESKPVEPVEEPRSLNRRSPPRDAEALLAIRERRETAAGYFSFSRAG